MLGMMSADALGMRGAVNVNGRLKPPLQAVAGLFTTPTSSCRSNALPAGALHQGRRIWLTHSRPHHLATSSLTVVLGPSRA